MNDAPTSVVVCDAGPLIHLNQLGCLNLLADFSRVLVPDVVWEEVDQHGPSALNQTAVRLERVRPREKPSAELTAFHRLLALDRGETQALQIILEVGAGLLLTDDTAARLAAQNLNLPVHGTLGILLRAIRRKQRNGGRSLGSAASPASSIYFACEEQSARGDHPSGGRANTWSLEG